MKTILSLMLAASLLGPVAASAATITRDGAPDADIASIVVVAGRDYDTAYISGARAPVGTVGTEAQTVAVLTKISDLLKSKGMGMGDVVMMRVFLNPDPDKGGHADRAGRDAAFKKFFGTPAQPNKPARTTVAVVDGAGGNFVEIDAVAVKTK